jgi:phage nucleotide-binding protein
MIEIKRTSGQDKPSLVMCVYGQGGSGKSTLASTAPRPVFLDAEEGTKALGARGIDVAVVQVKSWKDVQEAWGLIKASPDYDTVVVDPIGAFIGLLIDEIKGGGDMSIGKWGIAKDKMSKFIWAVKSSGKHVVFVAHEAKDKDEDKLIRSPKLSANLSDDLVNLCDVVGHLRVGKDGKRELLVQPRDKYNAKDRFDALGVTITDPNVTAMIATIHASYDKPPFV